MIRVGYYEFRRSHKHSLLDWCGKFFEWRDRVLSAGERTLEQEVELYGRRFGNSRATRLAALFADVRGDPNQEAHSRAWCEERISAIKTRLESKQEVGFGFRASDLVELGHLRLKLGRKEDALPPLREALALWKMIGRCSPQRTEAIARLQRLIARIDP